MDSKGLVTIAEVAHANEMQEDLRRKLEEATQRDAGRIDSVRATVLGQVVSENYAHAKDDLKAYVEHKILYPAFQRRVERHVQHCCDLIQAIQTKREFPGLASLSLSKQQELHEKVLEHFEELKHNLKHIEKIERDHKLSDVRTTVWVLKTLCFTVAAVLVTLLYLDVRSGLMSSSLGTAVGWLDDVSTWIVQKLPFL
jgi:hypothetical protein